MTPEEFVCGVRFKFFILSINFIYQFRLRFMNVYFKLYQIDFIFTSYDKVFDFHFQFDGEFILFNSRIEI